MKLLLKNCGYRLQTSAWGPVAAAVGLPLLLVGCASPGPPRPPSLHLPERITDLVAERHGSTVVLKFETPRKSTDGFPLTSPVQATVCREVVKDVCGATMSFPGQVTVSGDAVLVDKLPPDLTAGAVRALKYRVRLYNTVGRTAGWSEPAVVAGGAAPGAVEELMAEGSREGVALHWKPEPMPTGEVLLKRKALVAKSAAGAAGAAGAAKERAVAPTGKRTAKALAPEKKSAQTDTEWLRATGEVQQTGLPLRDSGGTLDASAALDVPYRYMAVRRRVVVLDGVPLELRGDLSPEVEVTRRDIYPPSVPQGVAAAAFNEDAAKTGQGTAAVDLVWQPNTEADLAGYMVYRQKLAADGTLGARTKMTEKVVGLPAFHDRTVERGTSYRYTVTAVDTRGNESAASVGADVAVAP